MPLINPDTLSNPAIGELAPNQGIQQPIPVAAPAYPPGYTFEDLKEKVKNLKKQWESRIQTCKKNRLLRNMQIDNEEMRSRGKFKPDEIYIPYHVINDNITKESAAYINFITRSKNAATFRIRNSAEVNNFENLERVFTGAVRYEGYEHEVFPVIDGHALHGLDSIEVKYEPTRPGFFEFEHIGYENLWYPLKVQRGRFQYSPMLVRNCEVTKEELKDVADIDPAQLDLLFVDKDKNDTEKDYACVQKVYYRIDGIVNICWMNVDVSTGFLRAPKPLHLGRWKIIVDEMTNIEISRQPINETFYNIVPFPYSITENKQLVETLGRAALDENTQEAVSSMVSNIINAYHRACQTFWAPKNPTSSTEIEMLDLVLENGRGLSQPVDFFSHPYPDAAGMTLVQALITQNKAETSQINFAVGNRADFASRKTAKEVDVAEDVDGELKATQVVLFSSSWTQVLNIGYLIFKSQVEIGTIKIEDFDASILQKDLILQAAGINEVTQRKETLENLQNLWPIIQSNPMVAQVVLRKIIQLMVPSMSDEILMAMQQAGMDQKAVLAGLVGIIKAIATEHPDVIPPESMGQLAQLLQQAEQIVATPEIGQEQTPQNGNTQTNPSTTGAATPKTNS